MRSKPLFWGAAARAALAVGLAGAAAAAALVPRHRSLFLALAVGALLCWALGELFALGLERFVGLRYLHPARRAGGTRVLLAAGLGLTGAGGALLALVHSHHRGWETLAVVFVLVGGLIALVGLLLRLFSVFTTVSTMGVVLGVASLVVVLAVTSGFEREFQDKVLALNAHLIVHALRRHQRRRRRDSEYIEDKLRGMPGVVRMAQVRLSAGEVMIGGRRQPEGSRPQNGGRRSAPRPALVGARSKTWPRRPSCPTPGGGRARPPPKRGRIALGAELARRSTHVGDCVSIMVPFAAGAGSAAHRLPVRGGGPVPNGLQRVRHPARLRRAWPTPNGWRTRAGCCPGSSFVSPIPTMALEPADEVRARLGSPQRIVDWKELNHNLFMALTMQKVIISLLLLLIIVVAAFNIVASLTMIVLSKVPR